MQLMFSFKKCAPCLYNFVEIFCHSTCDPNQNKFIKILETEEAQLDPKKQQVSKLSYSINYADVNRFFRSCSEAFSSPLQQKFNDLFGSAKYDTQLFANIGHLSPFIIDFYFFDGNQTYYLDPDEDWKVMYVNRTNEAVEIEFKDCNETSRGETCRCSQCDTMDCDFLPGIDKPTNCVLFGLFSCSTVVITNIYILILIVSVIVSVRFLRRQNPIGKHQSIVYFLKMIE